MEDLPSLSVTNRMVLPTKPTISIQSYGIPSNNFKLIQARTGQTATSADDKFSVYGNGGTVIHGGGATITGGLYVGDSGATVQAGGLSVNDGGAVIKSTTGQVRLSLSPRRRVRATVFFALHPRLTTRLCSLMGLAVASRTLTRFLLMRLIPPVLVRPAAP